MKRNIYPELQAWRADSHHKPLVIDGARQVGKTYIIREFCKSEYQNPIEVNLMERSDIKQLYASPESSDSKFANLQLMLGDELEGEGSVLFFDEIQESEEIFAELKYFHEKHPRLNIICSGSLLGVKLRRFGKSFPVGQIQTLHMHPMTFDEFLAAIGESALLSQIAYCFKSNKPLIGALHSRGLDLYRTFAYLGGMPEMIANFIDSGLRVFAMKQDIRDEISSNYFSDMTKYLSNKSESFKIQNLYRSITQQITNESKNFQFTKIAKNSRKVQYQQPLDWLLASNSILISQQISKPESPLAAFEGRDAIKLYLSDVGLLANALRIDFPKMLANEIGQTSGGIAENFVACEFAAKGIPLNYWSSNRLAEVDFLLENSDGVIPVEVKAGETVRSQSLEVFRAKYHPNYCIRISARNFGFENGIKSVPLYAAYLIS